VVEAAKPFDPPDAVSKFDRPLDNYIEVSGE
jgi:hypothetical protein